MKLTKNSPLFLKTRTCSYVYKQGDHKESNWVKQAENNEREFGY